MELIIGTISFLSSDEDNIKQYTDKERIAIIHSINVIVECSDENEAGELGEEALNMGFDSYLIPDVYQNNGDIIYECENDMLAVTVQDFKTDYLS